nr:Chain Q, Chymotrypsin-C [Homo sapiens]
CGVPSFPPNL